MRHMSTAKVYRDRVKPKPPPRNGDTVMAGRIKALKQIKEQLTQKALQLRQRLNSDRESINAERGGDVADQAFGSDSCEVNSKLAEQATDEYDQITLALQRIKDGTYGTCDVCDLAIPVERLEALPFSVCCVKCQALMEKRGVKSASEMKRELADDDDDSDPKGIKIESRN